jgi:ubiquitin-protein ligase
MIKRLPKEVLQTRDLQEQGIFYFFSEDNITKGTAYLFGPENTPYEFIPLEFSFNIPTDYPFVPPKVIYNTNDGFTRFHPNFYIEGKVCLSILGTYSGPKWASSLNISAVLLSIYSLITKNPLQHEPGYETLNENHPKCAQYSDYIEHNMIQLFFKLYDSYKKIDNEEFQKVLEKNKETLIQKVLKKAEQQEILYTLLPYNMSGGTSWKKLAKNISEKYQQRL